MREANSGEGSRSRAHRAEPLGKRVLDFAVKDVCGECAERRSLHDETDGGLGRRRSPRARRQLVPDALQILDWTHAVEQAVERRRNQAIVPGDGVL